MFRADRVERPFANGVRVRAARAAGRGRRRVPRRPRCATRPRPHWAVVRARRATSRRRARRCRGGSASSTADGADGTLLRVAGDAPDWLAVSLTMLGVEGELVEASDGVAEQLAALRSRVDGLLSAHRNRRVQVEDGQSRLGCMIAADPVLAVVRYRGRRVR